MGNCYCFMLDLSPELIDLEFDVFKGADFPRASLVLDVKKKF